MANSIAEIKGMLKRLNQNTDNEYTIQGSYGKWQIETDGGSKTIGHLVNKNTMYDQLVALNQLLEHEKYSKSEKSETPSQEKEGE